ncbi:peptidase S66 [[Pantoea] beijingensis]|uniref:Peptidase S66 n=1 Tax=[Pantoea] beijingensis TaxID=1324864 RepID=A0A443ICC1_9GAMM|nr:MULTISPECIES: muramoyltetrapeptide carboxypeptidase [Erwiniaceae]RWR01868.1 peptidase S66 [[Pantoea] beijingensis]
MAATSYSIHLIAPSGFCHNRVAAELGVARLQAAGHAVENQQVIPRRFQRFAGTDEQRLSDINSLSTLDKLPDVVLAVRGGYGLTRLLDRIDYASLRQLCGKPVALCGHSDFTALQLALLANSQIISFSGPMLSGNFGAEILSDFTVEHFWRALTSPTFALEWQTDSPDCHVDGTVWGGNLAMIASLIGTPYLPEIADGILVIEDVNEHPFRIERMLLQLHQSGILARQRAIVAGNFTGSRITGYDNGFDFASVWQMLRNLTGLPVITGLAFGHDSDTVTLPLGARGQLHVINGRSSLRLSGHPTI